MRRLMAVGVAVAASAALTLSACSSSTNSSGTSGAGSVPRRRPVPQSSWVLLTSLTGVFAPQYSDSTKGVQARLDLENANGGVDGHKLEYVVGDDTSTGPGAAAATQQLIQLDKVYGILDVSSFFSAAYSITTRAGTPVSGVSVAGGPEWNAKVAPNIFDAYGYSQYNIVTTTWGKYFKSAGATKVGSVAFGQIVSSREAAEEVVKSAELAGLQPGIVDTSLGLGSTDVGPIVQKIKSSGVDALYLPIQENSGFAIVEGLEQAGVKLKSVVLATGYGQDAISDPATNAAGQGLVFQTQKAPVEANTPGTQKMVDALRKYAGVTGIPSFGEYLGWITADLFIAGLKAAGATASQSDYISTLRIPPGTVRGCSRR